MSWETFNIEQDKVDRVMKMFNNGLIPKSRVAEELGINLCPGDAIEIKDCFVYDVPVNPWRKAFGGPPKRECEYCGVEWHPSKFHPGSCGECGGPR